MIVRKLERPLYHRRNRETLSGRGVEEENRGQTKSFDQYLIEAFKGEVVQEGNKFSKSVSTLTQENLIRLSRVR